MPISAYAEHTPPSEPFVPKRTHLAWRTPATRVRITWERTYDFGYGLARSEALAEAGIYDAQVDTAQFAQDVLQGLGDEISLSDLDALASVFAQAARQEREARALAAKG